MQLLTPRVLRDSPLGRRFFGVLVVAALAPITLLAVLADLQMSSTVGAQRDAELALSARNVASGIVERLRRIDELVAATQPQLAGNAGLSQVRWNSALASQHRDVVALARLDGSGQVIEAAGDATGLTLRMDSLSDAQRDALLRGRSIVVTPVVTGAPVVLVSPLTSQTGTARFVATAISPEFLWGPADKTPGMTTLCVMAGNRRVDCPANAVGEAPLPQLRGGAHSGLQWEVNGETMRAGAWSAQTGPSLAGDDWTVFAVQRADFALTPVRQFRMTSIVIAFAGLLLVLAMATRQTQWLRERIGELLLGTKRVADRDFGTRLTIDSEDEFGKLASSFNEMTSRLRTQIGTMRAMSRIDRAILNSVNLSEVATNSISCLRHVVKADLISIGLMHPESPERMIVQTRRNSSRNVEQIELHWPDAQRHGEAAEGSTLLLPPAYMAHLKPDPGQPLRILPISRAGSFWGVVVLGHDPANEVDADRAAMLSGVVDRLAVALSTAARDWRLHVQANFDLLTGLPNRAYLLELLSKHLSTSRQEHQRGAVLFLDLDRFKQTNDTLGHAAGDTLLRLAAERIRLAVRESDTVARIGGDEFAVVLPSLASSRDAGLVATNLTTALARPFEIDGQKVYAGASVGIALFPDDGRSAEDLLKRADTAMYRAKERGRGRYAFFRQSMGLEVNARATLYRELRQALERQEFVLHYQPVTDVMTGEITSAEALLRWQHPSRGLLPPGEFIEFAEESGLIESIGNWVLSTACWQHLQWENAGLQVPRIAVNASGQQLREATFVSTVDMALVTHKRRPDQLEIEITESMVIDGGERAAHVLAGLQQAGVCVAIDDFGTGYSSFGYLRTMPASVLKLDRSFVTDIATDDDADVIAASIIHMARTLRKTVVVEGVETEEQLTLLARHGAQSIQGFLVSKPLPPEAFEQFVRDYVPALFARGRIDIESLYASAA
jgi:diguanylate cyclase (GGDEF)-like protein